MTKTNKTNARCGFRKFSCSFAGLAVLVGVSLFCRPAAAGGINDAQSNASAVKRDPFWPVGYVPERVRLAAQKKTVKKSSAANDWGAAMKRVKINGVSSKGNNEFYAVINGELKSVGETFSIEHEGTVYTWAVASIQPPGSVRLRRVSAL